MRQLQVALVTREFAREQTAGTRSQVFLPPCLIEKGQRNKTVSIGNPNLEDAAIAASHPSFPDIDDIGNDGHSFTEWNFAQRSEFTASAVTSWKMHEQIRYGVQTQVLRERFGRAIAQNAIKLGLRKQHAYILPVAADFQRLGLCGS